MSVGPNIKTDWQLAALIASAVVIASSFGALIGSSIAVHLAPALAMGELLLAILIAQRIRLARGRSYLDGYAEGMEDAADIFEATNGIVDAAEEVADVKAKRRTGPRLVVPVITPKREEPN